MRVGRRAISALAAVSVFALTPAAASAGNTGLEAYKIKLKAGQLQELAKAGYDVTEARSGNSIEIAATADPAAHGLRCHAQAQQARRDRAAVRCARPAGRRQL